MQKEPFFLLLSYRAPHVPLDSPERYLSKFPNKLPAARRQALGMYSAIDDGIGLIQDELGRLNLAEKTCIFFLSDNSSLEAGGEGCLSSSLGMERVI